MRLTRIKISWLAILTTAIITPSCTDGVSEPTNNNEIYPFTRIDLTDTQVQSVPNVNAFAIDFFKFANENCSQENLNTSPYSLFSVLSMLANGDNGTTSKEILDCLNVKNMSIADLNDFNNRLLSELPKADPSASLVIANSSWLHDKCTFLDNFLQSIESKYYAESFTRNLSTDDTRKEINKWCETKSNGLIKNFLRSNLSQQTEFMLLNATYFKGIWKDKFDKKDTRKETFHSPGAEIKVEMMCDDRELSYEKTEKSINISLPYGNGNFMMTICVPNVGLHIDDFIKDLTLSDLTTNGLADVSLKMPKFSIESELHLRETVEKMGIKGAFNSQGFDNISPDKVIGISDILSKTNLIVDEEGTEAAVITGTLVDSAPAITNQTTLTIDRPFMFFIKETSTGVILFMGKVVNP